MSKNTFFASYYYILVIKISKSTRNTIQIPYILILSVYNYNQNRALPTSGITNRYLVNSIFMVFCVYSPYHIKSNIIQELGNKFP